jgi:mannose-6-phosphate isomerase-like protein (cupin superfamily)
MIIHSASSEPVHENPHKVDVRRLYDTDSAQVMHMTLLPGQSLKPHTTPVDVFFYILEGNPEVTVGTETLSVGPDHLVESPKDVIHCLANPTDKTARILVVKAPKPASKPVFQVPL